MRGLVPLAPLAPVTPPSPRPPCLPPSPRAPDAHRFGFDANPSVCQWLPESTPRSAPTPRPHPSFHHRRPTVAPLPSLHSKRTTEDVSPLFIHTAFYSHCCNYLPLTPQMNEVRLSVYCRQLTQLQGPVLSLKAVFCLHTCAHTHTLLEMSLSDVTRGTDTSPTLVTGRRSLLPLSLSTGRRSLLTDQEHSC